MPGRKYGLDMGSLNFQISNGGQSVLLSEKSMIAIRKKKDMVAFGDAAYDMFERTPPVIKVQSPISEGVIADLANMSRLTEALLKKSGCSVGFIRNNSFYLAVPSDISEVEKRAFYDLISRSSFNTRNIYIVEKPVAAAIGDRLPFTRGKGVMLVDMGAGTTEISVISGGGIAVSRLLRIGGNTINESIRRSIKSKFNIEIGYKTSEYVKLELASAVPKNNREITVYGRDLITGLPGSCGVSQRLVFDAMKEYLLQVIEQVREIIQKIPPEMMKDILSNGIYFTGGTTQIPALDKILASALQVKVIFSGRPYDSAVRGLGTIMDNPSAYRRVIISLKNAPFE